MIRISAVLFVCLLAAFQTSSAISANAFTATFQFTGQCAVGDCANQGIGQLTVSKSSAITLPLDLSTVTFVSFTYNSSKLNFTLAAADAPRFSGVLPANLPSPANVSIIGAGNSVLITQAGGNWCGGTACLADNGTSSVWGVTGTASVPALSLPAMIGLALLMALVGAILLRKLPNRIAA